MPEHNRICQSTIAYARAHKSFVLSKHSSVLEGFVYACVHWRVLVYHVGDPDGHFRSRGSGAMSVVVVVDIVGADGHGGRALVRWWHLRQKAGLLFNTGLLHKFDGEEVYIILPQKHSQMQSAHDCHHGLQRTGCPDCPQHGVLLP